MDRVLPGRVTRGRKNPLHFGLGARLKQTRLAQGLSRRALSLGAGVSHSVVWSVEEGRVPGLDTLEQIAITLGVSPCWLAYGGEGALPFLQKRPRAEQVVQGYSLFVERPVLAAAEGPPTPRALCCEGIGRRLKEAREARGLSRKELGRASDTSDTTVRQTEEARIIPCVDTAEKLAQALDVSPCWLAFGEGQGMESSP